MISSASSLIISIILFKINKDAMNKASNSNYIIVHGFCMSLSALGIVIFTLKTIKLL